MCQHLKTKEKEEDNLKPSSHQALIATIHKKNRSSRAKWALSGERKATLKQMTYLKNKLLYLIIFSKQLA